MAQPPQQFNELPDTFWAWLAGFIDGDGCIGLYGNAPAPRPLVTVSQKERHILDVIVARLGVGSVQVRELRDGVLFHGINWGSAASRTICAKVLPYLVTIAKRENAERCLAWQPVSVENRKNAMNKNDGYQRALEMYSEGMTMRGIARELGVSDACVLKWLKRAGAWKPKKRGPG